MIYAGILAGGQGTRLESANLPKQFLKIGGIPIIIRTIRTFLSVQQIDKVIVAMNPDWIDYCEVLFSEYQIDMNKIVLIEGGKTRFDSLVNIAKEAEKTCEEEAILLTHDCVRVFVTPKIILDNIKAMSEYLAVTTAVPMIDTVFVSEDSNICNDVPNRSELFSGQSPQTCKVKQFLELVESLEPDERLKYMEIGKLYIDKKIEFAIVPGDRNNFKITTDFDLKYAEFILSTIE